MVAPISAARTIKLRRRPICRYSTHDNYLARSWQVANGIARCLISEIVWDSESDSKGIYEQPHLPRYFSLPALQEVSVSNQVPNQRFFEHFSSNVFLDQGQIATNHISPRIMQSKSYFKYLIISADGFLYALHRTFRNR